MNRSDFSSFLMQKRLVVSDGATGTNHMSMGLPAGMVAEHWVLEKPDAILRLHRLFIENGAEIILTATFGASRMRLESSGLAHRFQEVNSQAVAIARKATEGSQILVAASLGPLGRMLMPMGTLEVHEAVTQYRTQAEILADSGADLLVIETQFDIQEASAAVRGALAAADLPLVCSFSYDRGIRTMMGVRPTEMAQAFNESGVSALGINCGKCLADNLQALKELQAATSLPIWIKPNAGLPCITEDGRTDYDVDPQTMAGYVDGWIENGSRLIGGCCGTSPEHLAAIAQKVHAHLGN